MKTNNPLIMGGTLCGFLAILSFLVNWRAGLVFAALAAALIVIAVRQTRKKSLPVEQIRQVPIQTISSRFEAQPIEQALPATLPKPEPAPKPEVQSDYHQLITALRSKGINVRAPLMYTGNDPITVQQVVLSVAEIARKSDLDMTLVARRMDQIYDKMWDCVQQAINKYDTVEKICEEIAVMSLIAVMEEVKK